MFNPFSVPVGDVVTESHLAQLVTREVCEGLWVEFKSTRIEPGKIAKAVAAFANSQGGWLIFGVSTNAHGTASRIHGVATNEWPDPIATIRDACKSYLDPFPFFESRVVPLEEGSAVVIVRIPESDEGPHVSRDGRVYVRRADSSDPIASTDRRQLEMLLAKGSEARVAFSRFAMNDRIRHPSTSSPVLSVYIASTAGADALPDLPYEHEELERFIHAAASERRLALLAEDAEFEITAGVPFNRISLQGRWLTLEQSDPLSATEGPVMELSGSGQVKIHVPVELLSNSYEPDSPRAREILSRSLRPSQGPGIRYYDPTKVWLVAAQLAATYIDFLGAEAASRKFKMALELRGAPWCVPFVDSDDWAEHVDKLGLPICRRDCVTFPGESRVFLSLEDGQDVRRSVGAFVGLMLGLPHQMLAHGLARFLFANQKRG